MLPMSSMFASLQSSLDLLALGQLAGLESGPVNPATTCWFLVPSIQTHPSSVTQFWIAFQIDTRKHNTVC
jgi:hypothetical protein